MDTPACDLCSQDAFDIVAERDRHGKPLRTAICKRCGLVRHEVIPSEEELVSFYATDYRKQYNGERVPGPRRVMRAWRNGERICTQVAPLLPQQASVLEVGAGIGCTVKVFEKAGFAARGIDPGGEFLTFSRDKLHACVDVCSLYDLQESHTYDAVLLVHVIEHLRSPRQAIQHISGVLKPGGMFYVECPNLQAPFARRSKLFHTAHIHNFVPTTLQWLAESCGFRLRKRFGDDQNPNLQMLFQHTGECHLDIESENCPRTIQDLDRSNPLPYHLRWRYISDRLAKVAGYANEHLKARRFIADLIRDCSHQVSADTNQESIRPAA